ncbi:MAG: hypothetical protein PHG83_04410 [Patescibacteria group bacterium]|jgi:hypothetical protein|nr:hypothetical protein [Patescibacteria group bacterium]
MNKYKFPIILIIISFILAPLQGVLADYLPPRGAATIEIGNWKTDFGSQSAIDAKQSTIKWVKNNVSLNTEGTGYMSNGVLWTNTISFNQDILNVTLDGSFDRPSGTTVLGFVTFDNDIREYPLSPLEWAAPYQPDGRVRKMRLRVFLASDNHFLTPVIHELRVRVELQDRSDNGPINRDNTRVSDLKKIRNVINNFYKDLKQYPAVSVSNDNKENKDYQWKLFKDVLDSASITWRKDYTSGFVSQTKGMSNDFKYGYLTGDSGAYYVMWVRLEEANSKHFTESDYWKGSLLGINCTPPIYCFSSKGTPGQIEIINKPFDTKNKANKIQGETFVRSSKDDPSVWLKINNRRLWIRDSKVLEKIGAVAKDVVIDSSIKKVPLFKFIKGKDDKKIYLITASGFKRYMPDIKVLNFYGRTTEVVTLPNDILNAIPDNGLIRAKGETKVYFLDQKIIRWVTSVSVIKKLGFTTSDIVNIDAKELKYYTEANPIF